MALKYPLPANFTNVERRYYTALGDEIVTCTKVLSNGHEKKVACYNGHQMSDWDPRNPFGRSYDLNTHWEQKAKAKIIEENLKTTIANNPNGCINDNDLRDPHVRFVFSTVFGFIRAPNPLAEESSAAKPSTAKKSAAIPIIDPVTGQEIKVGIPRVPPHMRHLKPIAESFTASSGHTSVSTTDEQIKVSTSIADPPKGSPHMSKLVAGNSTPNSGHTTVPTTDQQIKVGTPVVDPPKIHPHLRGVKLAADSSTVDSGYTSISVGDPPNIHPHLRGIKPAVDSSVGSSGHATVPATDQHIKVGGTKIPPHLRGIKATQESSAIDPGYTTVPTTDQHIKVGGTKILPDLRGIKATQESSAIDPGYTTVPTTDQHIKVGGKIPPHLRGIKPAQESSAIDPGHTTVPATDQHIMIHPHLRGIKPDTELSAVISGHTTVPTTDQHTKVGTNIPPHLRGIKPATDSSSAASGYTTVLNTERVVQTETPVTPPANSKPNSVQHSKPAGDPSTPAFRRTPNFTSDTEFVSPSPDWPKSKSSPPTTTSPVSASSATTPPVSASSKSTAPTTTMTIEEARLHYPPHMVAILFPKPKDHSTSATLTSPNHVETLSIHYQAQVCKSAEPQNHIAAKPISNASENSKLVPSKAISNTSENSKLVPSKAISNISEASNPVASKVVSNISGTPKHVSSKTTAMVSKPKPVASKTTSKYSKYSKTPKPVATKSPPKIVPPKGWKPISKPVTSKVIPVEVPISHPPGWVAPHRVVVSPIDTLEKVADQPTAVSDKVTTELEPSHNSSKATEAPKAPINGASDRPWKHHPELVEIFKDPVKYNQWLVPTGESEFANIDLQPEWDDFNNDKVSNDGVADIRAIIGVDDSEQLQNWNGGWTPAPCDWEDRPPTLFEDGMKSKYIERDWLESGIPCGLTATIDCEAESFTSGKQPISNTVFIAPIVHPESQPMPDAAGVQNENKRLNQTADIEAKKYAEKVHNEAERQAEWRRAQEARHDELAVLALNPEPCQFAPRIQMYARPVEMKDAQAIANIYNYYVVNSIIPEDQEPITVADVENIINYCNYKKLPFIVAVKGTVPSGKDVQGRPGKNSKIIMPQHENVIGFACIEYSQVGFSGSNHGLHRFTADVKVYVEHKSTRKGVGSNLMDHLIHILHFAYAFKNGCEFINPNNDPVYKTGGSGMWHVLNFRLPSQKKNDLDLLWISGWLKSKFAFYETARLKSWVRSSKAQGPCKFLDVVILQAEALQAEEIECDF